MSDLPNEGLETDTGRPKTYKTGIKYCVITKVPVFSGKTMDPGQSDFSDGNLYDNFAIELDMDNTKVLVEYLEVEESLLDNHKQIPLMSPVFSLGEILIIDGAYGRELAGKGRKPSKWYVEFETFDNVKEAILRAWEVLGYEKMGLEVSI